MAKKGTRGFLELHSNVKVLKIVVIVVLGIACILPTPTLAADSCAANGEAELSKLDDEYIKELKVPYRLEQPFGGKAFIKDIADYIQTIYPFALGIVGIIAVVLIMFGGLRWVAAAGNESTIGEAKEMIVSAVTGLVIALLSYIILLTINPKLVVFDAEVYKIPLPTACPFDPPEVIAIPTISGIKGGGTVCPGVVVELQKVADNMRLGPDKTANTGDEVCPTCVIGIGSTLRNSKTQQVLYECYQRAVTELNIKDGSKCTSGCSSCNKAVPPCCSNHEKGTAMDIWLEGVPAAKGLASSRNYITAKWNNGGKGGAMVAKGYDCTKATDPELCKNQYLLRDIMTFQGSKFKGISDEWWHFDYTGQCAGVATSCTPVNGYANNAYCKANGQELYRKALCNGSTPSCAPVGASGWISLAKVCPTGQRVDFTTGQSIAPGTFDTYASQPNCAI